MAIIVPCMQTLMTPSEGTLNMATGTPVDVKTWRMLVSVKTVTCISVQLTATTSSLKLMDQPECGAYALEVSTSVTNITLLPMASTRPASEMAANSHP